MHKWAKKKKRKSEKNNSLAYAKLIVKFYSIYNNYENDMFYTELRIKNEILQSNCKTKTKKIYIYSMPRLFHPFGTFKNSHQKYFH